jgi:hypothetical protein
MNTYERDAYLQYRTALSQWQHADDVSNALFEHCNTTQAAFRLAESEHDRACIMLYKEKANGTPLTQRSAKETKDTARENLRRCTNEKNEASRNFQEHDKSWRKLQQALEKATSRLPPPQPNALVLKSARSHTVERDGLGWGFEHIAIEQAKEYYKWYRAAAKRALRLGISNGL